MYVIGSGRSWGSHCGELWDEELRTQRLRSLYRRGNCPRMFRNHTNGRGSLWYAAPNIFLADI